MLMLYDELNSILSDRNDPMSKKVWKEWRRIKNKNGRESANKWLKGFKKAWVKEMNSAMWDALKYKGANKRKLLTIEEQEQILTDLEKISPGNEKTSENEKAIFDVARPKGHYVSKKMKRE